MTKKDHLLLSTCGECGSPASVKKFGARPRYYVCCTSLTCNSESDLGTTPQEAARFWNFKHVGTRYGAKSYAAMGDHSFETVSEDHY